MTATIDQPVVTDERVPTTNDEFTIGMLSTLDRTGDTKVIWDSRNKAEVEAAKATFDRLTKPKSQGGEGYLAYKAEGKTGEKGEQIRTFDKKAERIILVKPLVGG